MADRGDKRTSPLYYSWIDVSCHPEALEWFGLSSFNVPTVVYYQPKHNRFMELIGSFDFDNIFMQEERLVTGGAGPREAPVSQTSMLLSKECHVETVPPPSDVEDDDDEEFRAMLAEILAEEEARKAELGEVSEESSAEKKKVKKKKKSSSSSGKKKTEDL